MYLYAQNEEVSIADNNIIKTAYILGLRTNDLYIQNNVL